MNDEQDWTFAVAIMAMLNKIVNSIVYNGEKPAFSGLP
jgi:hypothetical protein